MATGLEIRAQIDSENSKGLLLINGGAAVALVAFLPSILGKPGLESVASAVLVALCVFLAGLAAAVVHNRLRRICSMVYEGNGFRPPKCKYVPSWLSRKEPCVCFTSTAFMWCSLVMFLVGGATVAYGGFGIVSYKEAHQSSSCWQLQELQGAIYRTNTCSGAFEVISKPLPPAQVALPSQSTEPHNNALKGDVAKATHP